MGRYRRSRSGFLRKILIFLCVAAVISGVRGVKKKNASEETDREESAPVISDIFTGQEDGEEERVLTVEELVGREEADTVIYSRYAYDTLSDTEKLWYHDISKALDQMLAEFELSETGLENGLTEENIDRIFQCVMCDHPEYFYVEGYTYTRYTMGSEVVKIAFSGTYSVDFETAEAKKGQIEAAAQVILSGISEQASDYEKIKYVYETLICQTEYDKSAPDNQNIYSVLVNRATVCQGYAKATQYLLNRLGVVCTLVTGEVKGGESHAWNLVMADGEYYYLDTTWGDPSYNTSDGSLTEKMPEISYDYLCITSQELFRTHVPSELLPLPECTATANNYYVREGNCLTSADDAALQAFFDEKTAGGKKEVTVKCADKSVYEEAFRVLLTENRIFEFVNITEGNITYFNNEDQLSIVFILP